MVLIQQYKSFWQIALLTSYSSTEKVIAIQWQESSMLGPTVAIVAMVFAVDLLAHLLLWPYL